MKWIEGRRLEMVIDNAVDDAIKQMRRLKGKDRKALQSELGDWFKGSQKIDIDEVQWDDHNNWW